MAWSIIKPCQCVIQFLYRRIWESLAQSPDRGIVLRGFFLRTRDNRRPKSMPSDRRDEADTEDPANVRLGRIPSAKRIYGQKNVPKHHTPTHSDQRTSGKEEIHIDCWRRMTAVHQIPEVYCQGVVRQLRNRNASRTLTSPRLTKAEGTDPFLYSTKPMSRLGI
ncbi:hypothetical protein ARMGADRAFT_54969 [Armillaria gallica]|uniref:Uncharacterized protein n=1 Tax=Armillaria gallica TaxID=47427 RepID=A0A2H3EAM7_ARMGA|nr:hypothetical protein ARMGADRAFT_54969 [Armillaria gallica]